MTNVIAYIELAAGAPRRVGLEAAAAAAQLAQQLGGSAHAVVVGSGVAAAAQTVARYGVGTVHVLDDASLEKALPADPAVDALEALARRIGPSLIVVGNTTVGRDIGSRLAARLDCGVNADVVEVKQDGGTLACVSPKLGGLTITTCAFVNSDYGIAAIRPNVFAAKDTGSAAAVEAIAATGTAYAATVEETVDEAASELGVEEASVIVSGGRGMGGPEPFTTILKDLAEAFGGAVGASRAAVDAGWISHSHQVGQTGKTVSPGLYVAVGISGAIQHKVGMRTAETIVAINKDAGAPIKDFADLYVVGDAFAIVPELTKAVREAKAVHA